MKKVNALLMSLTIAPALLCSYTTVNADEQPQSKVEQKQSDQIAEKVIYNGKEIAMKKETKEVKDAKPVTKGNHNMGSTVPKPRAGCDVFTVGDKSRPRQDFIDVSSYQSGLTQKDFNTLKSRGVKGVVVKLTEGTYYTNPYAKQQIQYAKNAGMKVSVYHFSHFQNKSQAEAEADYFAKTANSLGLSSDTLMVNDIEAQDTNNGYANQNSVYFALRLINTHKFKAVLHYGYQNWFDSGVLNKNILGKDSVWEASYPYSPSANNLWFKGNAEAWQFTSTMRMPSGSNYNGYLDGNIDYTGRFTKKENTDAPKCVELGDKTFVTVMKKNQDVFNNTSLTDVKQSTNDIYHNTYQARRYYEINGDKYYSIFDNDGNWQGYIPEDAIEKGESQGGVWIDIENKYIQAKSDYYIWNDLNFDKEKGKTKVGDRYYVKGEYHHYNGSTYYSLCDNKDRWVGYVNKDAFSDSDFLGDYHTLHKYYTLTETGYNVFKDTNLDNSVGHTQSKNSGYKPMQHDVKTGQTLFARGYYIGFNGVKYLSVFEEDRDDKEDGLHWLGYINEDAFKLANDDGESKGGAIQHLGTGTDQFVSAKGRFNLYNDFNDFDDIRGRTLDGEWFEAQRSYVHFNKETYHSLFRVNSNGKRTWAGYINARDVNFENNNFGEYHSFGKKVKVLNKSGYGLYKDKNFNNKVNMSEKMVGNTYTAKGYYDRLPSEDGSHDGRYYSIYDSKGNWQGYMRSTAFEVLK